MSIDPDYVLFAAIVDAGSLSAAGRRLHLSPAMVSKRLARLEARLGVRLIQRTTRRLALTELGARFHGDVAAILASIAAAEARVTGAAAAPVGPLRVTAPTSFGRLHIVPHVPAFIERYRAVDLELLLSDAYADLTTGRIDCAIRITDSIPAGATARRLATNRRVLCASPAYVAAHGAPGSVDALARHRLLAAAGQLPWRLTRAGRVRAIEGRSQVRTNSSEVVRELALAGMGIALRSLWDVGDALADGRLVRVLGDWEGPQALGIHALQPRGTVLPAASAFVDLLATRFASPPWDTHAAIID